MQIYVTQNGQQLGPFTEAELRAQLAAGTIFPQDLIWWEGQAGWIPVAQSPYAAALATTPLVPPGGITPGAPPMAALTESKTSGLAIGALVTGILFFFFAWFCFVPIILGHMALSRIRKNPGLRGHGMALAGTILGYVQAGLLVVGIIAIAVLLALGQQVRDTFKTINAQIQQAQAADTNSTENPATNNAPDNSNSSSTTTSSSPDTNAAPAPTSNATDTNSAPATTTNAPPISTNQ